MTEPLRDWLVTFAHKVAVERDYSARHPGHVFMVMLRKDEAEGLLAQANGLVQTQNSGEHVCETDEGEWRPCPASLCEGQRLAARLSEAK